MEQILIDREKRERRKRIIMSKAKALYEQDKLNADESEDPSEYRSDTEYKPSKEVKEDDTKKNEALADKESEMFDYKIMHENLIIEKFN